ncbi:MAG: ATP synthase F1 subunit epsilon [Magnetovibrio sp.]|nr:ATP synthase F1 subunit epsilon [Magnetovibrio sp.]
MADTSAGTVEFELVSPAKLLVSEPVEMVVIPGAEGDIGVLPGHSPLIATVRPGIIDIHEDGKVRDRIFVGGGFAEVSPNRCTVLAEEATPVDEINLATAEARLTEAREKADVADNVGAAEAARQVAIAEELVAVAKQASE